MIVEAVVACPKPEYCNLFPSGQQVVGVSLVVPWVLVPLLAVLLGLEALPSSANVQSHLTSSLDDGGNAS